MSRFIDVGNAYNTLTEYYGHKTDIQHTALADALSQVKTEDAIPLDWIRGYIGRLKDMGVVISIRDAQAVSVMVDKYMMEQNGNAQCGPDYCEIGGQHD
jgi:hypothetical protein